MRKTLNVALAVVLSLSMFATVAYVADPDRSSEYQLSLISAKAVTVQDATQGVRSYSDIVDTTRGYQVNDPINLAITAEVKNLEKPASNNKLKSIAGKTIKVIVGSPSIDLSYARLQNPTLLSHVWSGYTGQDVATVGYTIAAGQVLSYDKATNEVSWKFKGVDMYAMPNTTQGGYSLVTFTPAIDKDSNVVIPAIKLRDRDSKWTLGGYSYDITNEAPESVAYTMILQGVTKDNAGAATGDFYAKIEVASAEKFDTYSVYYVDQAGNAKSTVEALNLGTGLTAKGPYEWLDYVKVKVKKLEIAGAYNVYRYEVPASGIMANVPIVYDGDLDDLQGKTLALVQPNKWDFDNSTAKNAGRVDSKDVAGGVREVSAYANYTAGQKNATQLKYPLTSVVYSQNKAYYAPGYYGIAAGTAASSVVTSTELDNSPKVVTNASTSTNINMVDHFELTIPKAALASYADDNIYVIKADQTAATLTEVKAVPGSGVAAGAAVPTGGSPILYNSNAANTATPAAIGSGSYSIAALGGFSSTTTSLSSAWFVNSYTTTAGAYQIPMGDNFAIAGGTVSSNSAKRLTGKTSGVSVAGEYIVSFVSLANGDRKVIVTPSSTDVYPLSATNLKGNQWLVFYRDAAQVTSLAVTYANLNQRDKILTAGTVLSDGTNTYYGTSVPSSATAVAPAIEASALAANGLQSYDGTTKQYNALPSLVTSQLDKTLAPAAGFAGYTPAVGGKVGSDYIAAADALNAAARAMTSYWPVFAEVSGTKAVSTSNYGLSYGPAIKQISSSSTTTGTKEYLDQLTSASEITDVAFYTGTGASNSNNRINTVGYAAKGVVDGKPDDTALANAVGGTAKVGDIVFTSMTVNTGTDGHKYIVLGSGYTFTLVGGWKPMEEADYRTFAGMTSIYVRFTINFGNGVQAAVYDATNAAPLSIWDVAQNNESVWDIVDRDYHNAIVVYTITNNSTDRPWISMATEWTVYDSEDGYGLALFDNYNYNLTDSTKNFLAMRVYRSNDTNLGYGDKTISGYVNESASMIAALKYFGLDTGLGTTFRVVNAAFESKGAAAVYSENVTGTFKYGNLTIISDEVDESVTEEEVSATPDEVEPTDDDVVPDDVDPTEEPVADTTAAPNVVRTGDASTNVAIALAAAAVVAAAGLAFVMKKVR